MWIILLLTFIGIVVNLIAVAIFRGYVFSILWSWFIVSTFNLPELRIAQALGISTIVSLLTQVLTEEKEIKDDDDKYLKIFQGTVKIWLMPLISLGIGWIIKQYL